MKKFKPRKGWAKMQHVLFDVWGQILGSNALLTYLCIVSHSTTTTGASHPSYATIAAKCGISKSSAIRAVNDLIFLGFLKKENAWHPDGDHDSNTYHLLDIPNIEDVIANFLRDDIVIPKLQIEIIENLRKYNKLVYGGSVSVTSPSVSVTSPSVSVTSPSVSVTPPGGVSVTPRSVSVTTEIHTDLELVVKDTYLHTGDSENEKNEDSDSCPDGGGKAYSLKIERLRETKKEELPIEAANELIWEKLFSEEERQFVSAELAKLNDPKMSQAVLDEVAFKRDRIKLSLPVYTKGLVTKANAGSFTPTANLAKKRAENAQDTTTTKINRVARVKPKASRLEPLLQNELMRELQALSDKDDWFKYVCGTQFLRVDGKIIVLLNHEITLKHYKNKPKLVETIQAVTGLTPVIRVDFRENWEITN